jgi:hypothetical protein
VYENQNKTELVARQKRVHSRTLEYLVIKYLLLTMLQRVLMLMNREPAHPPMTPITVAQTKRISISLVVLTGLYL